MFTFLLLLSPPDPALLGSPEWSDREAVEQRLRALGPLAWPALRRHQESDDPEVRERVYLLLRPYHDHVLTCRAEKALLKPWPPHPVVFWCDESLRRRCYRIAVARGVSEWEVKALLPEEDRWDWFTSVNPVERCYDAILVCRKHLHAQDGWFPFP